MLAALVVAALLGSQAPGPSPSAGVIAAIRVQGNAVTPDADVVRLTGIAVGDAVEPDTLKKVEAALNASKQFKHVEVLQRFASISDPSQILIVIIVDEGPLKLTGVGATETIVRSGGPHLLVMPLLGYEDGYGFAFGARFAQPNPAGPHSNLSFPLTWGGDKHAGVDFDKGFSHGPLTRVQTSFFLSERTNPFFDADDTRVGLSVRSEREVVRHVTVGASASVQHVSFQGSDAVLKDAGGDIVVDTRLDPMLARNAVYARAGWSHVGVPNVASANRTFFEGRGYVGLYRQTILVLRAERDSADQALPPYLKSLLGGMNTLRGFRAGYEAGDTRVSASAELRVPLTSPLSLGKLGLSAFLDAGTAYQHGERYADQTIDHGVGGGIWFAATALRLNLDVAHGIGGSTRVHFGTSLTF